MAIVLEHDDRPIPVRNRILVEVDEVQEQTQGGIILPEVAREREQMAGATGIMKAAGPSAFMNEEGFREDVIMPGMRVGFSDYAGVEVKRKERKEMLRILNDGDILFYVGKEEAATDEKEADDGPKSVESTAA